VIVIASSGGDLLCPTCGCVFRHNTKKWFVVLPLAVGASAVAFYFSRGSVSPVIVVFASVGVLALVVLCMPSYVIVVPPYEKKA
jgi:hypothetical protein